MSNIKPRKAIQIVIAISIALIGSGCTPASVGPADPLAVGRYQIISEPSGLVLKIDTHDGQTFRLVNSPEDNSYSWEMVN